MSHLYLNKLNNSNSSKLIFSYSTNNLSIKEDNILIHTKYKNNSNKKQKKLAQFILGKKLGKGAFATVRLATHIKTNKIVAIKILEKEKMKENDKLRLEREIKILKKVRHKNIVNLYNVINSKKEIYIIMEYIKGTELFSYINEKKKLKENEACYFYQQIISGIEYLEKLKIVHRDIKPENIIIENNKNIKIIDFGLSNIYPENNILFSSCGSPCYAPPEMIMGKNYTGSGVDIWSSGIVLFGMLCGYLPFTDLNEQKLYKKIVDGKLYLPHFLSENAKDLLKKILNKDPLKRINIDKIKNHPWFNLINPKLTMSIGFLSNEIITPIDLDIVDKMVNNYGYNEKEIKIDLLKNKHNNITTTYYILLDSKIKKGEKSIADMKSDEYYNYVNNPCNLLSNYNYDIDKIIKEKVYKLKIDKKINTYNNTPTNIYIKLKISTISKDAGEEKIEPKLNKNNDKVNNDNINKNYSKLDIDNNEEYLYDNDSFDIKNNPVNKILEINNIKNNDCKMKKIKKRNISQLTKNKNSKFMANTTYFKKPKISIFESNEKNKNTKEKILKEHYKNKNIINDTNFIKEKIKKEIIFKTINKIENKNSLYNKHNNSYSNKKINNSNYLKNKSINFNEKENNNNKKYDKLLFKKHNDKIRVNSIINQKKAIKLVSKRTDPFNYNYKLKNNNNNTEINTFMNKSHLQPIITKEHHNEIFDKKTSFEFKKKQEIKNENFLKVLNKENSKNLYSNKKDNTNKSLKNKSVLRKKLFVNTKNNLSIDKKKLIKNQKNEERTNKSEKKKIYINNNSNKKYSDSQKEKTLYITKKQISKSKNKQDNNKMILKNKTIYERAESLKERNKKRNIYNNNKRMNTEFKSQIKGFNSKNRYSTIKNINIKKRNIFEKNLNNYTINNNIINNDFNIK